LLARGVFMWRPGNFAQSMFYFALKIKRPEVANGTYFSHISKGHGPETSTQWKSHVFDCEQLKAPYAQ
jgi:hypothetical protein